MRQRASRQTEQVANKDRKTSVLRERLAAVKAATTDDNITSERRVWMFDTGRARTH